MNQIYSRYEAYRLNLDGSLSCKENLDNRDELNTWFYSTRYANMIVKSNKGKFIFVTWNGNEIDCSKTMLLSELNVFIKKYIRG